MKTTRRDFMKNSAAAGGLAAIPYLWTSSYARAEDVNSKPTVAAIGVGGSRGRFNQGRSIARRAAGHGRMIACCDIDDQHTAEFNRDFDGKLNLYRDYRVLLEREQPDVVTIGTPDHWHVPISIAALRTGCDVYCEKPLTLTIQEGIDICKVVKETGRVFQVGTQQRSQDGLKFLKAIAIAQGGRLGKNVNAFVAIGGAPTGGPFEPAQSPCDMDWDLWLGPAPHAEYSDHRRQQFRWWFEYSGGKMTDWGAHHIDIAQWALGMDHTGPVKVSGNGKFPPLVPDSFDWKRFLDGEATLPNGYNTASEFSIDLEYVNGAKLSVNNKYDRGDGKTSFGNGILLEGDAGRIFVNRGKLQGKPVDDLTDKDNEELNERIGKLYKDKKPGDHMANFFQCLEDRQQPVSDVVTHHRSMTSCHLCNINLMLGRDLNWDPQKEQFVGDEQATALMSRKPRAGYA
ncbi:MAG: Gfo/Idh/MocA family oxidoreductase [Planctomycetota bacterium]|nr:Gfo/Idh/MocA family oxidoreductase [Planctomycetota bacterium]